MKREMNHKVFITNFIEQRLNREERKIKILSKKREIPFSTPLSLCLPPPYTYIIYLHKWDEFLEVIV